METFTGDVNMMLLQEMDSMMSMMHSHINRAITSSIAERVIPEIQKIGSSMTSSGKRDTESGLSPIVRKIEMTQSGLNPRLQKRTVDLQLI